MISSLKPHISQMFWFGLGLRLVFDMLLRTGSKETQISPLCLELQGRKTSISLFHHWQRFKSLDPFSSLLAVKSITENKTPVTLSKQTNFKLLKLIISHRPSQQFHFPPPPFLFFFQLLGDFPKSSECHFFPASWNLDLMKGDGNTQTHHLGFLFSIFS